jgi:single stranded DNA-binding protein
MGIKTHFDGKIGKQPELKGEGDKAWTAFGVATERYVGAGKGDERDGQQTAYKTTWVNVVAFGRQAQYITDRFNQGDTIVVLDGELEISTYEKKRDGNVIDEAALGLRVILKDIAGPFRSAPKNNNGGSNGNNGGGQNQQQSNSGRSQSSSSSNGSRGGNTSRSSAPPQQQRNSSPAQTSTITDDDIPF